MPQPSVSIGAPGDIALDKPVAEMSEADLKAAKEKVLDDLSKKVAAGNKMTLAIDVDFEEFKGTITMHRPSLDEERQIGLRTAKYLQGVIGVDVRTENLALFFSAFDVCVEWESAPAWFKPREMYDYSLLENIYGRFANWLTTFRRYVPAEQPVAGATPPVAG
jgi:hypothetical protein